MHESRITQRTQHGRRPRLTLVALASILFGTSTLVGCSAIVDPPEYTPSPVADTRALYLALDSTNWVYNYVERDSDFRTGHVAWTPMEMRMLGPNPPLLFNGQNLRRCSIQHHLLHSSGDYGMDSLYTAGPDSAMVFGIDHERLEHPWIDLKRPLKDSASWQWQFDEPDRYGQPVMIRAHVSFYDVSVALDNVLYHHLTEVVYTPSSPCEHAPMLTKKWFAQGVGLVRRVEYGAHGEILREWRLHSISK